MKIRVSRDMRHYIPNSVYQQGPFIPRFKQVGDITVDLQSELLYQAVRQPTRRAITIVGDTMATPSVGRYFATFLAQHVHMKSHDSLLYVYCDDAVPDEWTSVVHAPEMRRQDKPCALLISMGQTLSEVQRERARDIMAKWEVPTIIQCSGHNPVEIAHALYKPCHRAFYLTAFKPIQI
jgi:hypothetical protein